MFEVEQQPATESKSGGAALSRRRSKSRKLAKSTVTAAKMPAPAALPVAMNWRISAGVLGVCLVLGAWAYLPTFVTLVQTWNREPDYSHGFLVLPLAVFFLWFRRGTCPGFGPASPVIGLPLLALALAMRYFSGRFYYDFLDGWSILPWLAGSLAITGGRRLLVWSLPAIGFLWFMVPLPFGWETMLSLPLQKIATKLSCFLLQLLGQPAFADGNVIQVGEHPLEVAQACSGLRLFVSVVALAYVYVALVRRTVWEKAILILALVPIAILANALRIVATGLLFEYTSSQTAHYFAHEVAGWAMIPLAAAMFWGVLWYLRLVVQEEELMDVSALVRDA